MPDAAQGVFGDRLPLAVRYATLLATDGVVRGLIGPREAPRLWERHLMNCAVLEELIAPGASVCDIGSGAGLPGVVLGIARPDLQVTLVEPLQRRATFLQEVVDDLGLGTVSVVRSRAETHHGQQTYDVVTSRAVAGLAKLASWSMPLVSPYGEMIALKGGQAVEEVADAHDELSRLGCGPARVQVLGEGRVPESTWAVRIAWRDPASVSSVPPRSTRSRHAKSRDGGARRRGGE